MQPSKDLIAKYNVAGPRYTSYPAVPFWDRDQTFRFEAWKNSVQRAFSESEAAGMSIYIHLPYCESLCTFCGCHKHITKQHTVEEPYITAVLKEWELYLQLLEQKPVLKELHLGGGTPTFFSPKNLERLVQGILSKVDFHPELEMSYEGHPNHMTFEHLETLYQLGFCRVSFGVQDYSPKVQQTINRVQPFEMVKRMHEQARAIGYESISHDLVFGLPHQSERNILETIRLTKSLRPDRISLYSYAHVPWVKGVGQRGFNADDLPTPEQKSKLYQSAKQALLWHQYHEIGMDHFALKSDALYQAAQSKTLHRNFMGYTTNTTQLMIGLGMSAISDSWYGYAQNAKTVREYLDQINAGKIPVFRGHLASPEELVIKQHILNLMCNFETEWDAAFEQRLQFATVLERLEPILHDGLAVLDDKHLIVTSLGRAFIRNICMCFDPYLEQNSNLKNTFSKTI